MPVPDTQGIPPFADFEDMKRKINEIVQKYNNLLVNLDSINVRELRVQDGDIYYLIDEDGITAFNGTENTLHFDLETGVLTLLGVVVQSSSGNEKVKIDATGFHAYDESGVERITVGPTPSRGAKSLNFYGTGGPDPLNQGAALYDTETVDGASRTGMFLIGPDAQVLLFDDAGGVRLLADASSNEGFRALPSSRPQINAGAGWNDIAYKSEADERAYRLAYDAGTGELSILDRSFNVLDTVII